LSFVLAVRAAHRRIAYAFAMAFGHDGLGHFGPFLMRLTLVDGNQVARKEFPDALCFFVRDVTG
jgi:hypothetical protein